MTRLPRVGIDPAVRDNSPAGIPAHHSGRSNATSAALVEVPDVSWTEHWPFPRFAPRDPDEPNLDVDSDDSDTLCAPPMVIAPHPLSSDSVLADARRDRRAESVQKAESQNRVAVHQHKTAHRAASATGFRPPSATVRSFASSSPPNVSNGTITKEEITALASIFDPDNPLGGRVDMAHMDLQWIVRRRKAKAVVPPAVHLHLGNLGASLEGVAKDRQVLVNSPRSAIVLLRNGVTIADLKKQPTNLACAVVERKPFITLEQLTWEQKKYLAIETARVAKLREVVQEYRAVCDAVAFDDVVGFCNAYQPDRPSSAMLIPFSSGADGVRHQRRAPQEQCEDRLRTFLDRFHKREDRINRSAASLLGHTGVRARACRAATDADGGTRQHRHRLEARARAHHGYRLSRSIGTLAHAAQPPRSRGDVPPHGHA
jgi:hypothetical protein